MVGSSQMQNPDTHVGTNNFVLTVAAPLLHKRVIRTCAIDRHAHKAAVFIALKKLNLASARQKKKTIWQHREFEPPTSRSHVYKSSALMLCQAHARK